MLAREFELLVKKQLKNRFERMRRGGSSGCFTFSQHLIEFISLPSTAPKKGAGNIIVRMSNPLIFRLYYFKASDRTLTRFEYANPIPGGAFSVTKELICHSRFGSIFKTMIVSKTCCAYILQKVGEKLFLSIIPIAVGNEVRASEHAKSVADHIFLQKLRTLTNNPSATKQLYLKCLQNTARNANNTTNNDSINLSVSERNELSDCYNDTFHETISENVRNTYVIHNVGLHRDTYRRRKVTKTNPTNTPLTCLESRVCCSYKCRHDQTSVGRAGAGNDFCFALLNYSDSVIENNEES